MTYIEINNNFYFFIKLMRVGCNLQKIKDENHIFFLKIIIPLKVVSREQSAKNVK